MQKDYHNKYLSNELKKLKQDLFNNEDIILHTADISRNKNGFEQLKNPGFRNQFFEKLNSFMSTMDYKVIAAVIRKEEHKNKYGQYAIDPYHLCLEILIERFVFELKEKATQGWIIAEKRNSLLDRQLQLAFESLQNRGTRFLRPSEINEHISNFILKN